MCCGNIASICGHINTANTRATLGAQFGKAEKQGCRFERGTEESRLYRMKSREASSVTYVCREGLKSRSALLRVVRFSHWEIGFLT
jgi:hypothetical protein